MRHLLHGNMGDSTELAWKLLKEQQLLPGLPAPRPSSERKRRILTPKEISELTLHRRPVWPWQDSPDEWEYWLSHPTIRSPLQGHPDARTPEGRVPRGQRGPGALGVGQTKRGAVSQTIQSRVPPEFQGQGLYGRMLASIIQHEKGLKSPVSRSEAADLAHAKFQRTTGLDPGEPVFGTRSPVAEYRYEPPARRPEWGGLRPTLAGQMPVQESLYSDMPVMPKTGTVQEILPQELIESVDPLFR